MDQSGCSSRFDQRLSGRHADDLLQIVTLNIVAKHGENAAVRLNDDHLAAGRGQARAGQRVIALPAADLDDYIARTDQPLQNAADSWLVIACDNARRDDPIRSIEVHE